MLKAWADWKQTGKDTGTLTAGDKQPCLCWLPCWFRAAQRRKSREGGHGVFFFFFGFFWGVGGKCFKHYSEDYAVSTDFKKQSMVLQKQLPPAPVPSRTAVL